ncbi:MAG: diadenylate cyclase [Saprospiraceae bacterium]|jgi:diadenylate cyclase
MIIPWFEIGFLPIRIWDILDILIVGYLIYKLYQLLRGSIAFNIFIGMILVYIVWWLVRLLQMDLLSQLLTQFVSVGVLMLLIVFQPEVRRFLLILGNTTLKQQSNFLGRLLNRPLIVNEEDIQGSVQAIKSAMLRMSEQKTGALILTSSNLNLEFFGGSGVVLNANITQPLIESLFNKDSPLHDGAVVINDNKIHSARVVLPLSSNPDLPNSAGLRHRAAVGVTENTDVAAFIVSEESGKLSYAFNGKLQWRISEKQLEKLLIKHLKKE